MELLDSDAEPLLPPEPRRGAFGRRSDLPNDDEKTPLLLTPLQSLPVPEPEPTWDQAVPMDVRSDRTQAAEFSALPDDRGDGPPPAPAPEPGADAAEPALPAEAVSSPTAAWRPTPEQALLERLEHRLLEEHMSLIRKLAGR